MGYNIPLRVNTKKGRNKKECLEELTAFFNCFQNKGKEVEVHCLKERKALTDCTSAASAKAKQRSTLNYHLQRIARNIRR